MIETLIVDGYNIIHAVPEFEMELNKNLKSARGALEKSLRLYQARTKSIRHIYVIYDSKDANLGSDIQDMGLVKNIFASSASNADREIVSILKKSNNPIRIAVLSKDNYVINHARAMGANIITVGEFTKKVAKSERQTRKTEMSEEEKREVNDELRKIWGLK